MTDPHVGKLVRRASSFAEAQRSVAIAGMPLGPLFMWAPFVSSEEFEHPRQFWGMFGVGAFLAIVSLLLLFVWWRQGVPASQFLRAVSASPERLRAVTWHTETVTSGHQTGDLPLGERLVLRAHLRDGREHRLDVAHPDDAISLLQHLGTRGLPVSELTALAQVAPSTRVYPTSPSEGADVASPGVLTPFLLLGTVACVLGAIFLVRSLVELWQGTPLGIAPPLMAWLLLMGAVLVEAGFAAAGVRLSEGARARGAGAVLRALARGLLQLLAAASGIAALLGAGGALWNDSLTVRVGAFRVETPVDASGMLLVFALAAVAFWLLSQLLE